MTKDGLVSKDTALKMAIDAMKITDEAFTEFSKGLVKLGIPASILKLDKQSRLIPAIKACKEALEQPAQEPVAYTDEYKNFLEWDINDLCDKAVCKKHEAIPLYTSPQPKEWVSLTTKQLKQLEEKSYVLQTGVNDYDFDFIHFARYIEAKLKELNT